MAVRVSMQSVEFGVQTDRFDQSSGSTGNINDFYGKDFALYLAEHLAGEAILLNEDWGWGIEFNWEGLVVIVALGDYRPEKLGGFGPIPEGYEANWCVSISAKRPRRFLGIPMPGAEVDPPPPLVERLRELLGRDGIRICG